MGKINKRKQSEIIYLLGKLLDNGFSLSNSIHCLKIKYTKLKPTFMKIEQGLASGQKLSTNLKLLQLSDMTIAQLELAEQNGLLKKVILQVGKLMAIKNKQSREIKLLMVYPIFIFAFLLIIIGFIKVFFTFDYQKTQMSIWLEMSDWLIVALVGGGIIFVLIQIINIKKASEYDAVLKKIRLPIFGTVFRNYYEYNLLFSIGMMIKSGMKVSDICEMEFKKDSAYFQIQNSLNTLLKEGQSISTFIEQNKLIPNELDILTDSGLNYLDLGSEILALAQIKYDETLEKSKKIITKIQPIVFGIIAILILNTYLKILVPVYGMMEGMY